MSYVWTDDRSNCLLKLYRKGLSFSGIAEEIGCSRNAAIGRAHRMGLSQRMATQPVPKRPKMPAAIPKTRPVAVAAAVVFAARRVPEPPDASHQCLIYDLTNSSCRFPLWQHGAPLNAERLYCGAPEADMSVGRPYCNYHSRVCHPERQ